MHAHEIIRHLLRCRPEHVVESARSGWKCGGSIADSGWLNTTARDYCLGSPPCRQLPCHRNSHMTIAFAQDVVRHKGTPDSAFIRFNAERLRNTTRRDVGSAIAAPFSRCVSMRDTVSIVSPR